mgnify:FL=1|jgi:hypothetical protein
MSDNKEKDKNIKELPVATNLAGETLNDLNELMEWMSSPRVYWDNFSVTLPVEKPNDIKWVSIKIGEA